MLALQDRAGRAGVNRGAGAVGVHLPGRGREDGVHARGLEFFDVGVEGAGVGVQVLALRELQRVDEDADRDEGARDRLCCLDQGKVAFVERAHRGHEAHRFAGLAHRAGDLAELVDGGHQGGLAAAEGLGACLRVGLGAGLVLGHAF